MDVLLHDLLDLPSAAGAFVVDGQLLLDDILDSPELAANLAFHEAWASVLGVRPCRAEFASFVARAGGSAASLSVWSTATATTLAGACLCCQNLVANAHYISSGALNSPSSCEWDCDASFRQTSAGCVL